MSLFQQAMTRRDDCNAKRDLAWFGQHIRICADCRRKRQAETSADEGTSQ